MHFSDEAKIFVKAGNGGNGSASFRREKYVPKGGPDGGNGGKGGHIIFEADENINTLADFLGKKHYKADNGGFGKGKNMAGADGLDLIIKVPVGTLIYECQTCHPEQETLIADLTRHGQQAIIAKGGMGGKGNANFTTSVRQKPDFAELGEPGEEKGLRLELKLIADIAIIGYPSVGKSTLISRISNARPKIADYPFTTLVPNLGVVKVDDTDFVVADIPGLIEGAHAGKGLGDAFLKHIERANILVHLLDATRDDLLSDYKNLNNELKLFSKNLARKKQILVVNKTDATIPEIIEETKKIFKKEKPIFISAVTGEGIDMFLYRLKDEVKKHRTISHSEEHSDQGSRGADSAKHKIFRPHLETPDARQYDIEEITYHPDPKHVIPASEPGSQGAHKSFRITGKRIEQIAVMTDMSTTGGVLRVLDILKKIGAWKQIEKMGAKEGDRIFIGERVFEYTGM